MQRHQLRGVLQGRSVGLGCSAEAREGRAAILCFSRFSAVPDVKSDFRSRVVGKWS
ncbi:hypothetical protein Pmar_PMAR023342, partial [Perkinsus marinus ATCC 50983]